ncbi:uncharacterized protein LOC124544990 [Schistocerca americana]|uniref:uncharacterized protein LOC124544990 n=1 Tax=Schistocerca americana TaxID=7009 RepID=UPI001F4FBDA6|nr:uncharacterized protein LOC124544990 [Schistocerca americana]
MSSSTYIFAILVLKGVCSAPTSQIKPDKVAILEQENDFNGINPWRWRSTLHGVAGDGGTTHDDGVGQTHGDGVNQTHTPSVTDCAPGAGCCNGSEALCGTRVDNTTQVDNTTRVDNTTWADNATHEDNTTLSYKKSDGQPHDESTLLTADGESEALQGGYTWTSPEGITYTVTYTGDVPTIIQQGAGGVDSPLVSPFGGDQPQPEGPEIDVFGRQPDEPGFLGRPTISGNAALSLIGR